MGITDPDSWTAAGENLTNQDAGVPVTPEARRGCAPDRNFNDEGVAGTLVWIERVLRHAIDHASTENGVCTDGNGSAMKLIKPQRWTIAF